MWMIVGLRETVNEIFEYLLCHLLSLVQSLTAVSILYFNSSPLIDDLFHSSAVVKWELLVPKLYPFDTSFCR